MNPRIAFVIVGWNNLKLLKGCLDSIKNQTYENLSVIYVDNNSSDGSSEWVKSHYSDIKVVQQNENTGFARGNNIGIEEALKDQSVKYIGLLNTDCHIAEGWCRALVGFAKFKPKGACYQGITLDFFKPEVIDSTHIFVARNGQGTQGNWRKYYTHDIGPKKVFGVNAAACLISRSFIEAQPFRPQLFDETMYMYLEDVDLAARSTVMGWDNYLVPGARAYHMGSVSSSKNPGYSLYMTFRNNTGMLFKNFPIRMLFRMTPQIIRGDIDTIRTLRRRKQKGTITKVLKGRAVGSLRLVLFMPKHLKLRSYKSIDDEYLWELMRRGY